MATAYEAAVQVPYTAGFWMPHTEYEYDSALCSDLAACMDWLANNQLSYEDDAQSFVDIRIDGKVEVSWEFSKGSIIVRVP